LIGRIPTSQCFYSHYWVEHTNGHHKNVGTNLDPVSHEIGSNVYGGIVRAIIGTHILTWRKENERIKKQYQDNELSFFTILTKNSMVYYAIFHTFVLFIEYHLFGMGGVKFQLYHVILG